MLFTARLEAAPFQNEARELEFSLGDPSSSAAYEPILIRHAYSCQFPKAGSSPVFQTGSE
jgi:hypothetical protein